MGTQAPYNFQESLGDNLPMMFISWHDAQVFAAALKARNPASTFRLPTEAEWEFAARADTTTRFYWGDDPMLTNCDTYAWTISNSEIGSDGSYSINEVGLLRPNPWHLLDMSGNVLEWVQDRYHENYVSAPNDGSAWGTPVRTPDDDPLVMLYGVVRGGCSNWSPGDARSAFRFPDDPDSRRRYTGFRIVMEE
jgi:formylglycine-generating enzyme required for sulfatase activity